MKMVPLTYRQDPRTYETNGVTSNWWDKDKTFVPSIALKTSAVDLRPYTTTTDQLNIGACAGNATADAIEILFNKASGQKLELSRLFVYSMARTREGTLQQDAGTYVRTCFEVLSIFGICTEKDWPYDTSKVFVSPSILAQRAALGHKIHAYYRIKNSKSEQVIHALNSGHPVVFGTLIDKNFMNLSSAYGPILPPTSDIVGGHAMTIVGFNGFNFIVKNSWGSNWGDGGFWYMTPEYVEWGNTWDLWVPCIENPNWLQTTDDYSLAGALDSRPPSNNAPRLLLASFALLPRDLHPKHTLS